MQQTWLIVRLIIKRRLKIRHIITTTKNKDTTIMKKLIMLIVAATLSLHGLAANIDEVFTKIKNTVKVEDLRRRKSLSTRLKSFICLRSIIRRTPTVMLLKVL